VPPMLLGAVAGVALGSGVYRVLAGDLLTGLIGLFILVMTWVPLPHMRASGRGSLFLLGFYQTGLGMVVGATGPLGATVLSRIRRERDWLVVNTGVSMCINHAFRTAAFVLLGFSFQGLLPLLAGLALAVSAGSWLGTRLRWRIPAYDFSRWFRWLMTLLALRMIVLAIPWP